MNDRGQGDPGLNGAFWCTRGPGLIHIYEINGRAQA